jgi:hypothetical protein
MSDTIQIRHDALLEVVVKSGGKVLNSEEVEARSLDGHIFTQRFIYDAYPYSANVGWRDPKTGLPIVRPQITYTLVNPEDQLKDGELCTCEGCEAT